MLAAKCLVVSVLDASSPTLNLEKLLFILS